MNFVYLDSHLLRYYIWRKLRTSRFALKWRECTADIWWQRICLRNQDIEDEDLVDQQVAPLAVTCFHPPPRAGSQSWPPGQEGVIPPRLKMNSDNQELAVGHSYLAKTPPPSSRTDQSPVGPEETFLTPWFSIFHLDLQNQRRMPLPTSQTEAHMVPSGQCCPTPLLCHRVPSWSTAQTPASPTR